MSARKRIFSLLEHSQNNFMWFLDHLLGDQFSSGHFPEFKKNLESRLLKRLSSQGPGQYIPVQRVRNIDKKTFYHEFVNKSIPVILDGAAKEWKCCQKWSFDYLKDNYGRAESMITNFGRPQNRCLSDVISMIQDKTIKSAYLSPVIDNNIELFNEIDFSFLKSYFNPVSIKMSRKLFIGGKGVVTPLHAGMTNNLFVQVYGQKKWYIIDPIYNPVIRPKSNRSPLIQGLIEPLSKDFARFPAVQYMDIFEADLAPGDVLFNPSFFWHYVTYPSDSISVGVRWFSLLSSLRSSAMLTLLVFLSTNPTLIESFFNHKLGRVTPFNA